MSDLILTVRESIDRVLAGEATADDVLTTINVVDRLKALTRELAEKSETAVVEWLKTNGDLEVGEVRYYAGVSKTTKCRDHDGTIQAILAAAGGDLGKVAQCLGANAWKTGACRELLPADEYEGLFEVVESADLRTGKPKVKVQKFDGRFNAKRAIGRTNDGAGAETVDRPATAGE